MTDAEKEILRARARALAQEPEPVENADESLQVIEFLLAEEHYGIETAAIREVYPLKELTPLPCTPAFVLGMVNVRGQILPVINVKRFFDLADQGLTDLNKMIIVRTGDIEVGLLADAILGVRSVPTCDLQPPLPTLTGIRADFLRGVTPARLVVLNIAAILSDKRLLVQEEVEA